MKDKNISAIFQDFFKQNSLKKPIRVVVGYSGGIDSSVLLDLLSKIETTLITVVGVLHVNHNLRPTSSLDAEFSKAQASRFSYPFYLLDLCPLNLQITNENWGREVRYQFFEEKRKALQADYILTAHHKDDQIETFFFKMIFSRFGPLMSLIKERDDSRHLLRPLLTVSKVELLDYAKKFKVPSVEDESNRNNEITRNKIRNKLIPDVEDLNSNYRDAIATFVSGVQEDQLCLDFLAKQEMKKTINQIIELPNSLASRALFHIVHDKVGDRASKISFRRIKDLLFFLRSKPQGQVFFNLGFGVVLRYDSRYCEGELQFIFEDEWENESEALNKHESFSKSLSLGELDYVRCPVSKRLYQIRLFNMDEQSEDIQMVSPEFNVFFNRVAPEIRISGKAPVDEIILEGGVRKRLSRYLKDKKLPLQQKKSLFYISQGDRILWIPSIYQHSSVKLAESSRYCLSLLPE